ncbi:MAG: hypothetical protein JSS27_10070 [Planctomycetes bacterium]|nr:hypothetical protein [Planctomycetota bacterium]
MTKDDMEIVSALQLALADKVGSDRYELWFGAQTKLSLAGDTLEVRVATTFYQDWLRRHFRGVIEQTSSEVVGRPVHVMFRVDATLAEVPRTPKPRSAPGPKLAPRSGSRRTAEAVGQMTLTFAETSPATDATVGAVEQIVTEQVTAATPAESVETQAITDAQTIADVAPRASGKLAVGDLALYAGEGELATQVNTAPKRRPLSTLEGYMIGDSNRLAHASACGAALRPGAATPLLLHGATGVGKTHLIEGIVSRTRRTFPQLRTVSLTAEQFTSYFMGALHGSGLPSFRMKYRGVGLLAIDDIQFFAGKRATIVELLHTVDALLREGKQVVLSADRPADQLMELGPEFVARLQGGLSCPIDAPEYETRRAVVARQAAQMELDVPSEVCAWLAAQITTHARALTGALRRLALASEALGKDITVQLAEETLGDLLTQPVRQLRLSDIEAATCDVFNLDPRSLQSSERGKRVDCPRMLAMWLARKHTRSALSEIGEYFGRRSHSTVISASKKIDAYLNQSATFAGNLKFDELVRRVEQRLGAG